MNNSETKIIIAGFGGQGVVLSGAVIAKASIFEDKNVTGMVSYGAEMRGGTANASIIVSDHEIASPFVTCPDVAIILNQPSLDKFESVVADGGTIIMNTSMTERELQRDDLNSVKINASNIAREMGNVKIANIIALGAFIGKTKLLKEESILLAIEEVFSVKKPELVDLNKKAFQQGLDNVVLS